MNDKNFTTYKEIFTLRVAHWALGGLKTKFENFAPNFAQQGQVF